MRPTRTATWLKVAEIIAQRSTCARLQVGCVLTDEAGERIWVGHNGGPRGGRNGCARATPGACGCVHAEANACVKADGHTRKVAYITAAPCELCAVLLVNSRVVTVHAAKAYRDDTGTRLLRSLGIPVHIHQREAA